MSLATDLASFITAATALETSGPATSATQDCRQCTALFHSPTGDKANDPSLADALEELATGDYADALADSPNHGNAIGTSLQRLAPAKTDRRIRTDRVAYFRSGGQLFIVARVTG